MAYICECSGHEWEPSCYASMPSLSFAVVPDEYLQLFKWKNRHHIHAIKIAFAIYVGFVTHLGHFSGYRVCDWSKAHLWDLVFRAAVYQAACLMEVTPKPCGLATDWILFSRGDPWLSEPLFCCQTGHVHSCSSATCGPND